jgi:hypothetical protein
VTIEALPSRRPNETPAERADRNLAEMLQELRVALPGVQVLFAFLLVVPFNQRFPSLSNFERDLYFATLLCAALSSALLIAPSAQHRILFRHQDKEHLVVEANRLVIAGLAFLALAMVGVVTLTTSFIFGATQAIVATVVVGTAFVVLWYVIPLLRRRQLERSR